MGTLKAGLVIFGLVIGTAAMAQGRGDGKTPQERAQFRTDWMAKELSLTEEQKAKVAGLNLEAVQKNQAIKNDASLTADQKKVAWKENRKAQKTQMKAILTADQLATLKAKHEAMQEKHKQGKGKHEGRAAKTPEERAQFKTDQMAKELSLTEAQKTKVKAVNLAAIQKNDLIRKDAKMSADEKKAAFKTSHEEQKAKLKEILTPEQMATLKVKKEEFKKNHPEKSHPQKK